MRGCLIKTYAGLNQDGSRTYPRQTQEQIIARTREGLEYGLELARMRVGGTADLDDVLVWLSDEDMTREPN